MDRSSNRVVVSLLLLAATLGSSNCTSIRTVSTAAEGESWVTTETTLLGLTTSSDLYFCLRRSASATSTADCRPVTFRVGEAGPFARASPSSGGSPEWTE